MLIDLLSFAALHIKVLNQALLFIPLTEFEIKTLLNMLTPWKESYDQEY